MPSTAKIVKSLAQTAVAVIFTGPVGGLNVAARQAIELISEPAPPPWNDPAELLAAVQTPLLAFARSENVPQPVIDQAFAHAEDIIRLHGLAADELLGVDLDPDRSVEIVLTRAQTRLESMGEVDGEWCRKALRHVYRVLVQQVAGRPELTAQYRREMLGRLASLDRLPAEVAATFVTMQANAMLTSPAKRWVRDRYPASALLRAEYQIVPFWGRTDVLTDLEHWVDQPGGILTRLYVGAGGMGKTRLMLEATNRMQTSGWRSGFLADDHRITASALESLAQGTRGVVAIVDYSETRIVLVGQLVQAALNCNVPTRIVLLARSTAEWWSQLRHLPDAVGDYLNGPSVSTSALSALAEDAASRQLVIDAAAAAFRQALGVPEDAAEATEREAGPAAPAESTLASDTYDRVLFLLIRALAAVEGEPVSGSDALLDFALRREQQFWDSGLEELDLPTLTGRPIRQAAALATLAGTVGSHDQAVRLLDHAPLLRDQTLAVRSRVAELLHRLYPGVAWLSGVQPDLLGEHLVRRALEEDAALLEVLGGA